MVLQALDLMAFSVRSGTMAQAVIATTCAVGEMIPH